MNPFTLEKQQSTRPLPARLDLGSDYIIGKRKERHTVLMENFEPMLDKRIKSENSGSSALLTIESPSSTSEDIKPAKQNCCSCKKSQCLKLYCECFANGSTCGP